MSGPGPEYWLSIDERLAKQRACRHNLWHYYDDNGNRRCLDCRAFVRPVEGAAICAAPEVTP